MGVPEEAPKLVVVSGYPAAGKTTLSRRLAHDLHVPLIRKDALKPALVDLAGSWPPPTDSWRFGRAARLITEAFAEEAARSSAVIVDSNFNWDHDRTGFTQLVGRLGAETFEVCLWGDPVILKQRWEEREGHTREVLDEALHRAREPVTTGEVREFDTTDFAALDAAYPTLLNDLRWFLNALPKKRVAAGLLLRDARGRVVLVHQNYGDCVWNLPGGLVERGESPDAGASREVNEEIGLDVPAGRILDVDHTKADALIFVYDGGVLTEAEVGAISLQEAELDEWALVEPDRLEDHLTGARLARVQRALQQLS